MIDVRSGGLAKVVSVLAVFLMVCCAFCALMSGVSAHTRVLVGETIGGPGEAWHINANGQVVGALGSGLNRAFVVNPEEVNGELTWFADAGDGTNELLQDLGDLGGWAEADAVNIAGQIAGTASYEASLGIWLDQAYLLTPTTGGDGTSIYRVDDVNGHNQLMQVIPGPSTSKATWCWDMNENGDPIIVGLYFGIASVGYHGGPYGAGYEACVWSSDTGWVSLGTFGGFRSLATVVSDNGVIVGYATDSSDIEHAFVIEPMVDAFGSYIWYRDADSDNRNDLMKDLGTIGGTVCRAECVNNIPVVVGYGVDGTGHSHALRWENASGTWQRTDLTAAVPLWIEGAAYAINDKGDIAGMSNTVLGIQDERYGAPVVYSGASFHYLETGGSGITWWISPKGIVAGGIDGKPAIWKPDQAPTAVFTATVTDSVQHIVEFDASLSVDWDGSITSYDWDFGDGSPISSTNTPIQLKAYLGEGTYIVTLTVTDNDGYTDVASYSLTLTTLDNNPPTGSFTFTVNDLYVSCTATASDGDGTILRYWWYWGDGTMNDWNAPTNTAGHTYSVAGTYTITLRIWDDDYAIFDSAQDVAVVANQPPTGSFTYIVDALMAYCTVTASDVDGTIDMLFWDWGDGSTSQSNDPVYYTGGRVYGAPGTYTITLTIYDDDSATCVVSNVVTVVPNQAPIAVFTYSEVGATTISLDATASLDPDGGPLQLYSWDVGDGATEFGQVTSHTYGSWGTYSVTLTITDDEGSTGSATEIVYLTLAPVADFTFACSGDNELWLQSTSHDPDGGSIVACEWDFGDLTTGSGESLSHTFPSWGLYDVTLTVTDDDGETSSKVHSVVSSSAPIAEFISFPVAPYTLDFDAGHSFDPDGGMIGRYFWNFGDGSWENTPSEHISHTYAHAGTYWVSLIVEDMCLVVSAEAIVEVGVGGPPTSPPQAVFTAVSTDLSVVLDAALSVDPDGGEVISYAWDFGDFETATVGEPTYVHDYWVEGTYTVTLTVTDDEGETGTASTIVTVSAPPPPEPEALMADLEVLIMECHDANGNPIDQKTMESLKLKVDTAFDIVSMRKSGGSPQSAEMRKSGGANLMIVFISMTESYTIIGKIDAGDGWNMVVQAATIVSLLGQKTIINGVPNYEWYNGCGPTAAGMILAYWDAHGFEGLIAGEPGLLQTPDVNRMIASKDHILEYALGVNGELDDELDQDYSGPIISDASQWGPNDPPPHQSDCLADFMRTSWSSLQLRYGQSVASQMVDALEQYTAIAPSLTGSSDRYSGDATEMHMASFTWDDLKAQIDNGHPLAVTVDANGDGDTDHLVTVVGYCELGSARVYAFHSTWDNTVYWANFEIMRKNVCFGIFSGFTFDIVDTTPVQ